MAFVVNMANVPSTLTEEQIVRVVEQAMEPWNQVATAELALSVRSVINDPLQAQPTGDGVSVVFWDPKAVPRGDMVAGKAYRFAADCDILLQPQVPFTLLDVKAIMLHELGHCLGLAHSAAHGVMTKFTGLPSIGLDDAVAVSLLYPRSETAFARETATLTGRVECHGKPCLGAVLRVVDRVTQRIAVAGFSGLTDQQRRVDRSGAFELPGVTPGRHLLRVEPMDPFVSADPPGYGSPVEEPPAPFAPVSIELPELSAGDTHDLGKLTVEE